MLMVRHEKIICAHAIHRAVEISLDYSFIDGMTVIRFYIVGLAILLFCAVAVTREFGVLEMLATNVPLLFVALDLLEPERKA